MTGDCPTSEELIAHLETGRLPEEIELHAATPCHSCQERIPRLRRLLRLLQELPLEEVSEERLRRASKVALRDGVESSPVKRWVAELLTPSPGLAAPAMRGPATGHQELYRAGSFEIALARLPNGALVGQVFPLQEETELMPGECVLHGDERSAWASLTPGGEFRFVDVAPGAYTLVIETGEHCLVLRDVILGEPE